MLYQKRLCNETFLAFTPFFGLISLRERVLMHVFFILFFPCSASFLRLVILSLFVDLFRPNVVLGWTCAVNHKTLHDCMFSCSQPCHTTCKSLWYIVEKFYDEYLQRAFAVSHSPCLNSSVTTSACVLNVWAKSNKILAILLQKKIIF